MAWPTGTENYFVFAIVVDAVYRWDRRDRDRRERQERGRQEHESTKG